ncbi:hypothetical protein JCM14469_28270 [Desulfatiferula olefinivorans]
MRSFVNSPAVRTILSFFRRVFKAEDGAYDTPAKVVDRPAEDAGDEMVAEASITRFGEALADAEYLISRKMFREALVIYRKLNSELTGKDELMKIQFVREKIEMLLSRINQEPTLAESAQVIAEEKRSAEERYAATVLEADHYFEHELYNESLFLYLKLQKEWAASGDLEKINHIREKVAFLNEVVDDDFKISLQPIDTPPVSDLTVPPESGDLSRLFGEMISDAEELITRRQYREALGIYRKLNSDLAGTGELMKIQYVRDKIERLIERINLEPTAPEAAEIIAQEKRSAEERFSATLNEADQYFEHALYDEALFLYRKLAREWAASGDRGRIDCIAEKIRACDGLTQEPVTPDEQGPTVYLNDEGSLTDEAPPAPEPSATGPTVVPGPLYAFLSRRRLLLIAAHALLLILGMYALVNNPLDTMPSPYRGEVYIITPCAGMGVDDVEALVTVPVEKAIEGMAAVQSVTSLSERNRSSIRVVLTNDASHAEAYARIKQHVLAVRKSLPATCGNSDFVFVDDGAADPVVRLNLAGKMPEPNRQILADQLKTVLKAVPGVRHIDVTGKSYNEVHVSVSPEKLKEHGLTFYEVCQALRFAGSLDESGRISGGVARFSREADVMTVLIRKDADGRDIRMSDVATAAVMKPLAPKDRASVNGTAATRLTVLKNPSADTVSLVRQIRQKAEAFRDSHREDGLLLTVTDDASEGLIRSFSAFVRNLTAGALLMAAVLWIGLGFRNTVIAMVVIPLAVVATLFVKYALGIPLYTVNLLVFMMVAGMLVDSTVVVVEAIHRQWTAGKALDRSTADGLAETARPMAVFLVALILGFAPMFLGQGPMGSLFLMIPLPLMFALTVCLAGALIVAPAHMLQWGRFEQREVSPTGVAVPRSRSALERRYAGLVGTLIRHKRRTSAVTVLLLAACLVVIGLSLSQRVGLIDVDLVPDVATACQVQVIMPDGVSIDTTDRMLRDLSALFVHDQAGENGPAVTALAGRMTGPDGLKMSGERYGSIMIPLRRHEAPAMVETIRMTVSDHLEAAVPDPASRPRIRVIPMQGETPLGMTVGLRLSGSDPDQVLNAADRLIQELTTSKQTRGLIVIGDDRPRDVRTGRYALKPSQAQEPGVADRITEILAAAEGGVFVGKFQAAPGDLDLNVRLNRRAEEVKGGSSLRDLYDMPVIAGNADTPARSLGDLVMPDQGPEPDFKRRINGRPSVTIWGLIENQSDLTPQDLASLASGQLQKNLAGQGAADLVLVGAPPETADRFNSFFIGLFIASFVIYLILGLRFGDFIQPLIVFVALAFPLIGVTAGLVLGRFTFTAAGLMALVGIAMTALFQTLLMVEGINARIRDGLELDEAIIEACTRRIKPVLLTTLSVMLWFLPMALGLFGGSAEWTGMALTLVVGMGLTSLLTVCAVPVHYAMAAQTRNLFTGDPV